ncbi:MAG: NAD-dependent protein deacylase [Chitinivibrionia bacterium]|nr:NAD-dependent protein deacylase [Chitinivibrionia bacterium]
MNKTKELYEKITNAKHCVAFTGAGISTLSGIRDFRGKNGLYKDTDADKIFDLEWFHKDPWIFYGFMKKFIDNFQNCEPSVVHNVLAKLEKSGHIKAVITQNVDLLHQKAGSENVIEVHGSPKSYYCIKCGDISKENNETVIELLNKNELPKCEKCGGILKPSITFFGEAMPEDIKIAQKHAQKCDFMLVLGTSLNVYPAAAIPEIALRSGGDIAIVNDMETHLDKWADFKFKDLESVFCELDGLC